MTFLAIALVVSVALDIVEYASIRQEERAWNAAVEFYRAQREADGRRYVDTEAMR